MIDGKLECRICELEKEENKTFNVSCKFKVFEEDGKSMFSCSLCNQNYKLGDFGKKIQNVKFHASSRGYLANVYAVGTNEEIDSTINTMFDAIEMELGKGIFLLNRKNAHCKMHCRCCKIDINLACRGNPVQRAREHANSRDHKERQGKFQTNKTRDIASFFIKGNLNKEKTS
ncbi:unnamed protein product [Mytilus coruscus]|uniref:Uncharacterized protein n=1 Tax=Mytilus coruscus TaxID=42192 RepID=A0A6J8C6J1_MYTCO|nr:unnamed protein product [Mytilus coruscus]